MSNLSRSQRTRREILDTAWELIAQRGAEVSLAEIAKAAGITRQSIYVHFGSRGGLLVAMVRRTDERESIIENLHQTLTISSPAERLDACLRVWLEFVPKIHPVARDLIRLRSQDEDAARAWGDRMQELLEIFTLLINSIHQEKALAPFWKPSHAADYLWTACSVQSWELLVVDRGWSPASASEAIRHSLACALLK